MLDRCDLRRYQEHGAEFFRTRPVAAGWIDMGLGKTVMALTAFNDGLKNFDVARMLVIAPLRVARKVWSDEVATWAHLNHLSVSTITGTENECFRALKTKADIHTINRERVPWLHAQFIKDGKQIVRWPWDIVVADESQSFKSQSSQRYKCLVDIRRKIFIPKLIELSGTPSPNGYSDLWSQLYLLDNGTRLGTDEKLFRERFFTPPVGIFTKWSLKPRAAKLIQSAVKDIVLALREEDYLTLPPILDNPVRVQLSSAAMRTYKEMQREYIAEVAGQKLTAVNAGVLDGKLLQLANGACYKNQSKEWVPFHDAKLEALDELLEEIGGKVLITYAYQHDLARILRVLEKRAKADGRAYSVLKTDKSFDEWAAGDYDWGVLHPASAGHGLNDVWKAGAEDLIYFGAMNNYEWFTQVSGRLTGGHRRVGKNIRRHHILADGTRDDDYRRLIERKALSDRGLMEALAVRISS